MTFAGGPGARHQPNHHHHHHHVSPSAASSALTARSLFDLARLHPDPYVNNGGLAAGLSYATTASHVKSTSTSTATTQLLPPPAVPHLRLTAREDSTRVKLQKQRLGELHRRHISGDRIPGFKTSAAFLSSLRTNLRLHASPPSSPTSTPPSMQSSTASLPPPSPLSPATSLPEPASSSDPLAHIPDLRTHHATSDPDRAAALRLVADSIAQQRQAANRALLSHPLNLAALAALLATFARYVRLTAGQDWPLVLLSCAGALMAALAACRFLTQGYLHAAEEVDWDWLDGADVLVTTFGDEVIAAAVVEWVSGESARGKRKKAWRGEIRAWTVRLKYRGKGVGGALLEDVVKEARGKGAESLGFAGEHANSKRVLPVIYNSTMDARERRARELLQDLLEVSPTRAGKKRS